MDALIDSSAREARERADRLGTLAAENARTPAGPPAWLAAALDHVRRRQARRDAHDKLRANHFIMDD
jgi:hypothetical protein